MELSHEITLPESALVLLDAMPDGVLLVDPDGRIVLANAEAEAMFSYGPKSMLGLQVEMLVPSAKRHAHQSLREGFQDDPHRRPMGRHGQRLDAVTSHGSVFPTEISLSPYHHDGAAYVVATVRNVSERVQIDRAHRRVLASLDALPSLVIVLDPTSLWISYANDGARAMTGYSVEELTAMTPLTLLPDLSRDYLEGLVAAARHQGGTSDETELLRADGHRLPLEVWVAFLESDASDGVAGQDAGDTPVCVLFGRDLTDRRQAEAQHRAVLDKLRRVAVTADISIWAADQDGVVEFAQGAEWDQVGRLDEALGRSITDVFEQFPSVLDAFQEAQGGREASTVVTAGAEARQITFQPVVARAGDVVEVIGTAVDVGELEESRRAVALERDRLGAIHHSMSQGMLIVSAEGRVLETNPAFCGLVGRSRSEVLSSHRPFPFLSEQDGIAELDSTWAIIVGVGHSEFSTELIRPDGTTLPVLVTFDRMTGRPDQALVLFSDLSARQRYEADLDSANAVLVAADERERIARDLHDRVIQRIFATGISLQSTQSRTDDPRLSARLGQAVDELDLVIRELRTSVFELHQTPSGGPAGVRRDTLAVVDDATRVLGFRPDVRFDGVIEDLDVEVEVDLLAVLRESLTNVARHASATSASVAVTIDGGSLELVVEDNGIGVDTSVAPKGHGLRNMTGRAEGRGGTCELISAGSGMGSTLTWRVPL